MQQQPSLTQQTQTTGERCLEPNLWPKNFQGPQIDLNWHPSLAEVTQQVMQWHKQTSGGLVLAGGYGCGKTAIAKIIIHAVGGPIPVIDWSSGRPESIRNAVFYSEPELLADIRETYGAGAGGGEARIVTLCQQARLLIIDDLGVAYVKEESQRWYEDLVWRILNERFEPKEETFVPAKMTRDELARMVLVSPPPRKTLITTNLTPPELKTRIGGRAYSRLKQILGSDQGYISMFDIPDYRAKGWTQ